MKDATVTQSIPYYGIFVRCDMSSRVPLSERSRMIFISTETSARKKRDREISLTLPYRESARNLNATVYPYRKEYLELLQ